MPDCQLAVYDFAVQPTLGEFYLFLQASLSLSAELGIAEVDLCIICDPSRIRNRDFLPLVEHEGDLRGKVFEFLTMTQLHPRVRNVFVVNRLENAIELAQSTEKPYRSCWPTCEMFSSPKLINGQYIYYANLALLDRLHHGREITPRLCARPKVAEWAKKFLADHCGGGMPVTVNLRNNPTHCVDRNMDARIWRAFFDYAATRHACTFFLLGAANEDFSEFRDCRNAVITKNWNTSMEQDFALIEHSSMHMGSASGPATILIFMGDKPTLVVNGDTIRRNDLSNYRDTLAWDGAYLRFSFGNPNWRMTVVPETTDSLASELETMLGVLTEQAAKRKSDAAQLESACAKGMELQIKGELDLAGQVYRTVLNSAPQHELANYCLGMLYVQSNRPSEGLPHVKSALLANLNASEYWLGYLEVLMLVGRLNEARNILNLALRQGFAGAAFDDFAKRLNVPSGQPSTAA
jgi:hypothetical protein